MLINVEAECFVCGSPWTEEHHVVYRSQGGTETASICRKCHDRVHAHRFELEFLGDGALVLSRNGVEILRRKTMSDAEFAQEWDKIYEYMAFSDTMEPDIPRFSDGQLKLAFQEAQEMQQVGQRLQRKIIAEYLQRMEVEETTKSQRTKQVAMFFRIGFTLAGNLVRAIEKLGYEAFTGSPLGKWWVIKAAGTDDPNKWLEHFENERLVNEHYSRDDAEADLSGQPRPGTCPTHGIRMTRTWKCQECES